MILKRFNSILLCLMILATSVSFSYAAETESVENGGTSKELYVLSYLGIIDVTEDEVKTKAVTRADFSEYLCKAIKTSEVKGKVYFNDVQTDCWAEGYINALYEAGIISPAADKMFNPNDAITYEQACKMLVYALGYGKWVDYNGGSMSIFTQIASRSKFGITPSDADKLSVDECALLLYKAMQVDLPEFTGERVKTGDTLFESYHGIYIKTGRVRTVASLSLDNKFFDDGRVQIDNELFHVDGGCNLKDFFGQNVEYIYKKSDDDNLVIYAERVNEGDKITVSSKDIKSVDEKGGSLEYYTDNGSKTKTISFSAKSDVFFNGEVMETHLSDRIQEFLDEERKGKIEFIKAGGTSEFNLINIISYEVFVIGMHDKNTETIYDYYNSANKTELDDVEYLNIIDTNGMSSSLPTTFPATVLIAKADNNESIEIVCCNEKKDLSVERQNGDIKAGKTYKLGWLKKGYLTDKGFGEYSLCLDIYDHETGKSNKLYMADNITIDAEKYKSSKYRTVVSALPGTNELDESRQYVRIEPQIIRYSLNDNNDITNMDTANCGTNEDKDNSLTEVGRGEKYFSASNSWLGIDMVWQNGYTKMFMVPEVSADGYIYINGDRRDDDDNMYSNSLVLSDWRRYNVVGYKWSEESWNSEAIVVKQTSTKAYDYCLLFDSIYTEIDSDGMIKDVLKCEREGGEVTFFIDSTMKEKANALKQGDIFTVDTDYSGKTAINITKMFDCGTRTFESYGSYTDPNRYWYRENPPTESTVGGLGGWRVDHAQLAKGYAKTIKGSMLSIAYTLSDARDGKSTMPKGGVPVTIYEKDSPTKEKIYSGSINDIKTYDVFGEDCSLVVYCAYSGRVREIIVYK